MAAESPFFDENFGSLQDELKTAKQEGKQGHNHGVIKFGHCSPQIPGSFARCLTVVPEGTVRLV